MNEKGVKVGGGIGGSSEDGRITLPDGREFDTKTKVSWSYTEEGQNTNWGEVFEMLLEARLLVIGIWIAVVDDFIPIPQIQPVTMGDNQYIPIWVDARKQIFSRFIYTPSAGMGCALY